MKHDLSHKFKTPAGYFDQMEKDILSKTVAEQQVNKVIPFYQSPVFQIAAVLVGALMVSLFAWQMTMDSITPQEEFTAKEVIYDTYFEDESDAEKFVLDDAPLYADFVSDTP